MYRQEWKERGSKQFGNFFCILYFLLKESFEIFPGNCHFLPVGILRNASEALKRIKNISKYKLLAIRAALRDRPLGANLALSAIYFSWFSEKAYSMIFHIHSFSVQNFKRLINFHLNDSRSWKLRSVWCDIGVYCRNSLSCQKTWKNHFSGFPDAISLVRYYITFVVCH